MMGWVGGQTVNQVVLSAFVITIVALGVVPGVATAQDDGPPCPTWDEQPLTELLDFVEEIQQLGVAVGLRLAVVVYVVAGLAWMRGTIAAQEWARRLTIDATVGLLFILLSSSLVMFVAEQYCPVIP